MPINSLIFSIILHLAVFVAMVWIPMSPPPIDLSRRSYQVSLVMGAPGGENLPSPVLGPRPPVTGKQVLSTTQNMGQPEAPAIPSPEAITQAQQPPNIPAPEKSHADQLESKDLSQPKQEELKKPEKPAEPKPKEMPPEPKKAAVPNPETIQEKKTEKKKEPEPEKKTQQDTKPKETPKKDKSASDGKNGKDSKNQNKSEGKESSKSEAAAALADLKKTAKSSGSGGSAASRALADLTRQTQFGVGGGGGSGDGPGGGGIYDVYTALVIEAVRPNWSIPVMGRKNFQVGIRIKLDKNGKVLECKVERPSGRSDVDASAINAVKRTGTLPKPPSAEQRNLLIYFNTQEQ